MGARQHYGPAVALQRGGMLQRMYTDLYFGNKPRLLRMATAWPEHRRPAELQRCLDRLNVELPPDKVTSFDALGLLYSWRARRTKSASVRNHLYAAAGRAFGNRVARTALNGATAIYGFNGAARQLFEQARSKNVRCILEQSIAPLAVVRRLMLQEAERWPGWEAGVESWNDPHPLEDEERREWELADLIIAGSTFVGDGLISEGVPAAKIVVVPYGVDLARFVPSGPRRADGKLRLLFAGSLELRKGAPYLLEALRLLKSRSIEMRIVGTVRIGSKKLAPYRHLASFEGSVPRANMAALYQSADAFVFPSICEGSALVTYEATACGLPLVTTPNAGTLCSDGIEGAVVPAGDVEAIAAAIDRFATNPSILDACRRNVLVIRDEVGFAAYSRKLLATVARVVSRTGNSVQ